MVILLRRKDGHIVEEGGWSCVEDGGWLCFQKGISVCCQERAEGRWTCRRQVEEVGIMIHFGREDELCRFVWIVGVGHVVTGLKCF